MATYRFGELIGSGGFGQVLKATRVEDGWQCAVKRLSATANEEDRKRFHREVRMQAQLRHNNIVEIIGYNLVDDPPWFVMPRALFNLRDHIDLFGGNEDDLWVIYEIAAGIKHAHDNGVLHRDLKPENILIFNRQDDLYAAVSDFGLGRFFTRDSTSITETHVSMGTPAYMAPEQCIDAKNVDHRADIFALGKILYEVLTGEIPYPEMDYSKVPRKFVYIIQKCCRKNCEERYRSIEEMINDLSIVTQEEKLLTRPAQVIQDELRAMLEEQDFSTSRMEKILRLLIENTDDNEILTKIFPRLPDPILQSLVEDHITTLAAVLEEYDKAVSGGLPFEYCDTVADFYEKVFQWTDSDQVRIMILRRLFELGYAHNRWHVGVVFARIVASVSDASLILAIADILRSDDSVARWYRSYLLQYDLPQGVRDVLRTSSSIENDTSNDDIPF